MMVQQLFLYLCFKVILEKNKVLEKDYLAFLPYWPLVQTLLP